MMRVKAFSHCAFFRRPSSVAEGAGPFSKLCFRVADSGFADVAQTSVPFTLQVNHGKTTLALQKAS